MPDIAFLSVEDVLRIHEILAVDFARANDPISPAGVRSLALLESAVGRQQTGARSVLKYGTPIENAATLLYGICNDHPFHNGNKRTALVAMLVHLDKNNLTLKDTDQKSLFDMVLSVAAHTIVPASGGGRHRRPPSRFVADDEVAAVVTWIKRRASKPHRGERQITYRELRRLLACRGITLETSSKGNSVDICMEVEEKPLLRRARKVRKRIGAIGYRDEGTFVSIKDLKMVRQICQLTEDAGVDSDAFYDQEAVVDAFINKYRKTLRRLSKR